MGCVCVGNKMIINPKLNQNKLQKYKLFDKNWKQILNYLSKDDLKEVSKINKYFHNLISELNYIERKTEVEDRNIEILKFNEKIKKQQINEKYFLSNNNDKININYEFENKKIIENKKGTINFSKDKTGNENHTMSPVLNLRKLNIEHIHSTKQELNVRNSIIKNNYLNTEIIDNETKIGSYFDIFTNMKIYVNPKNNQFQNSSVSGSSLSYNGTPTFSDYSNNKSILNSNISNHFRFTPKNQNNNNSYVIKENIFPQNTNKNINKFYNV